MEDIFLTFKVSRQYKDSEFKYDFYKRVNWLNKLIFKGEAKVWSNPMSHISDVTKNGKDIVDEYHFLLVGIFLISYILIIFLHANVCIFLCVLVYLSKLPGLTC